MTRSELKDKGTVVDHWSECSGEIRQTVYRMPDGTFWMMSDWVHTKPFQVKMEWTPVK